MESLKCSLDQSEKWVLKMLHQSIELWLQANDDFFLNEDPKLANEALKNHFQMYQIFIIILQKKLKMQLINRKLPNESKQFYWNSVKTKKVIIKSFAIMFQHEVGEMMLMIIHQPLNPLPTKRVDSGLVNRQYFWHKNKLIKNNFLLLKRQ